MPEIQTIEDGSIPEVFRDEAHLEQFLSTPTRGLVQDLAAVEGDILVLGVGGKVGPTLAMMAKRAAPHKRVLGAARFSDARVRERLQAAGVETISCDLLDRGSYTRLPDVPNVIYMAGKKFGTAGEEPFTWAMNAVVPTYVGERFRGTRFVAFSTLCVYPFVAVDGSGSSPDAAPLMPLGEYSNSCVARERIFQFFSRQTESPGRLVRLVYAIDCRYGVLHDVASWVLQGQPIDIRTGIANCIWQGDAIAQILRCLQQGTVAATPINIGAPAPVSIRQVAQRFGKLLGREPIFEGTEQRTAWHPNCAEAQRLFGDPLISLEDMIRWNADWLKRGLPVHHKPTHYEQREGVF